MPEVQSTADLSDLLRRVKEATGPDRETLKRCQTCRWWNTEGRYVSSVDPKPLSCERITDGQAGKRGARLYPVGSGSYLATLPDFGCTLHEQALTTEGDHHG